MAFQAWEVLRDVATITQDREHVRWTLPEKLIWLNAGLREIPLHKPNAKTERRSVALAAGTLQAVPDTAIALLSVVRNVAGGGTPVVGRGAIRMSDRVDMDASDPTWHDPAVHTSARLVKHAVADPDDPKAYYVFPPNDGTGYVELLTSEMPTQIVQPALLDDLAAYSATVDLDDIYRNALTDYVVYRCYAKDTQASANAARAATAYALFGNALGVKLKMEAQAMPRGGE